MAERLVVGLVRGLTGLRGTVRVEVLSDQPQRFAPGSVLYLEAEEGDPLTVDWTQSDGPGLLVRFRGIGSREAAERLRNRYLEAIPTPGALPEGSYWWHELEGALVSTTDGEELGRVAELFRAGGGEVLVVRGGPRGELYVPTVHAVVRELAPKDGRIVVDAAALDLAPLRPRRPRGRRSSRRPRQPIEP